MRFPRKYDNQWKSYIIMAQEMGYKVKNKS